MSSARYLRCRVCRATFLDPSQRLSPADELRRYRRHQNNPDDAGYRAFLAKCLDPLLPKAPPGSHGLDYGCGPGPVLAQMLREAGRRVDLYDPFFFPDQKVLECTYDFIFCTEAVEHFHRPAEEFTRFARLLKPGGWLAVMTRFMVEDGLFASWSYRRDPTHVVFFNEFTLRYVAGRLGWSCEFPAPDVALMQKPPPES